LIYFFNIFPTTGADANTLALLGALLSSSHGSYIHYLLPIGVYRDNKVGSDHPLTQALNDIKTKGGVVRELQLLPLQEEDIVRLLEDSFNKNPSKPLFQSSISNLYISNFYFKFLLRISILKFHDYLSHYFLTYVLINNTYKINSKKLTGLIKKTQGNPFFINQLLHILHKNKHITFVTSKVSISELNHKEISGELERVGV
jgi:predicted ATPase